MYLLFVCMFTFPADKVWTGCRMATFSPVYETNLIISTWVVFTRVGNLVLISLIHSYCPWKNGNTQKFYITTKIF